MRKYLVEKIPLILSILAIFLLGWILLYLLPKSSSEVNLRHPEGTPHLDRWLARLANSENCDRIAGTWDSGSLSYGKYCYKKQTWQRYASSTKIAPYATDAELMNFIGDDFYQDEVTRYIVFNDRKSVKGHWKTSIAKKEIGLP